MLLVFPVAAVSCLYRIVLTVVLVFEASVGGSYTFNVLIRVSAEM